MIKVAVFLALAIIAFRWALGSWPWEYLSAQPPRHQAVTRARRLLGVDAGASADQIREAHRQLAAKLHPDRGGSDARLAEINAARDLLLAQPPKEGPDRKA